ncbi:hypothetical protein HHK36_021972 [Tetracentron sinense]|uniref:Uncharacterized protein n=1 Tax=Tetracentron sinense TaxID=13715 RepID=A0A835D5Y8_TETSI|nr:hypothetical protein HHK36_021972 [Tetracentron sinense]
MRGRLFLVALLGNSHPILITTIIYDNTITVGLASKYERDDLKRVVEGNFVLFLSDFDFRFRLFPFLVDCISEVEIGLSFIGRAVMKDLRSL